MRDHMGTSYTLSIGYLSGDSFKGNTDAAWQVLVDTLEHIKQAPERIVTEARRLDAPEMCGEGCCTLQSLAEAYQQYSDATLIIHQTDGKRYVTQLATGDRTLKEHVRRAFCRLVIEDMHRQGIEVNLIVS